MLSCKEISELASHHLEHKLPFMKQMQFKMHLFMCRNCRQFMDQFQLTIRTISTLKPMKPDNSEVDKQVNFLLKIAKSTHKNNNADIEHK